MGDGWGVKVKGVAELFRCFARSPADAVQVRKTHAPMQTRAAICVEHRQAAKRAGLLTSAAQRRGRYRSAKEGDSMLTTTATQMLGNMLVLIGSNKGAITQTTTKNMFVTGYVL